MNDGVKVVIRTSEQLSRMNEHLVEALKNEVVKGEFSSVPVIYQYLHRPNEQLVVDSDNTIGKMTDVRFNTNGDIVGTFHIMHILKVATNFQGVIDNIAASVKADDETNGLDTLNNPKFTVDAFIVYDKVAKDEIIRKKKAITEATFSGRLAKPGVIPIDGFYSDDENIMLKHASEKLIEEFKNQMSKQPDKSE